MGVEGTVAKSVVRDVFDEVGGWFRGIGSLVRGEYVARETWHVKTGVVEKTFANGLKVVEAPGKAAAITLPERWRTDGALTQLREGTWARSETWHAATGVTEKTLDNGIHVVATPGKAPVVTLPRRFLTGGPKGL